MPLSNTRGRSDKVLSSVEVERREPKLRRENCNLLNHVQTCNMVGSAVILAFCAALAALGKAADQMLLRRQVKALDDISIRYWNYLDDLKFNNIPFRAVGFFLRATRVAFGEKFGFQYVFRVIIISCLLTLVAIPGGRILGLLLTGYCNYLTGVSDEAISLETALYTVWGNRPNFNIPALVLLNLLFDFLTVSLTIALLSFGLRRGRHAVSGVVVLDTLICIVLLISLAYFSDGFDSMSTLFPSGFPSIEHNIAVISHASCSNFYLYTSRVLFSSTVLLPTLLYLSAMFLLLIALEGFYISRAIGLHILEKSVEDEKRSIVGHTSTAIALMIAVAELVSVFVDLL